MLTFFFGSNDKVTLLHQPVMKLIGGVYAGVGTDFPYLLVSIGPALLSLEHKLNRAGDIPAELPALVIYVALYLHGSILSA